MLTLLANRGLGIIPVMAAMDLKAARADLDRALSTGDPGRLRAARAILLQRGAEALGIPLSDVRSLDDLLRTAATMPASQPRRDFAVLLVHAFGFDELLPMRGKSERALRLFVESALLNPLRRAGYPFDGSVYDRRQVLCRLHTSIDEHLRPPDPSIPPWLHGLGSPDSG